MSDQNQIPMVGPDGTPGMVDQQHAQEAANSGYSVAHRVYGPDGAMGLVKLDNLKEALNTPGYTAFPANSPQQTPVPGSKEDYDASKFGNFQGLADFGHEAGQTVIDAAKGLYHSVADAPRSKTEDVLSYIPGALQAKRLLVDPQVSEYQKAQAIRNNPNATTADRAAGVGHTLAAAIPVAGPLAQGVIDKAGPQFASGDVEGGLGTLAGNAAIIGLGDMAARGIGAKVTPETPVPGENFTPTQARAMSSVVARTGNGMGKNLVPQQVIGDGALSQIRQTAANHPELAEAIHDTSDPVNAYGASQGLVQQTLSDLEAQHAPVSQQFANVPADTRPIQNAIHESMKPTLDGAFPEERAALQDLADRAAQVKTLEGLNDFRQHLNAEAAPSYQKTGIANGRSALQTQALRNAADATRNAYYDQLQNASGIDFTGLKKTQANLMGIQEGLQSAQSELTRQHAISEEPRNLKQFTSDALGNKAYTPSGLGKVASQAIFKETPLTRIQSLMKQALEGTDKLPQTQPLPQPPMSTPTLSAQNPLPPNRLLPADAIANAEEDTPVDAGGIPARPATVVPQVHQPLLPAEASQSQYQDPSPSPALNPNAARMRVEPPQFIPPEPTAVRKFFASPEGQLWIERLQLGSGGPTQQGLGFASPLDLAQRLKAPPPLPESAPRPQPDTLQFKQPQTSPFSPSNEVTKQEAKPIAAAPRQTSEDLPQGQPAPGVYGKETNVLTSSNAKIPAKYKVVDLNDLTPSHSGLTRVPNPEYGMENDRHYESDDKEFGKVVANSQAYEPARTLNTNPDAVNGPPVVMPDGRVLGGNSRVMTLQRVYASGADGDYRAELKNQASSYGLDPNAIDQMQNPVLVREVPAPQNRAQAQAVISGFNDSPAEALNQTAEALSIGRKLKPETLNTIAGMIESSSRDAPSLADAFRAQPKQFIDLLRKDGAIPDSAINRFFDNGALTDNGRLTLSRALMGRVVDDYETLRNTPEPVLNKATAALPNLLVLKARGGMYDISAPLRHALDTINEANAHGIAVVDEIGQQSMSHPRNAVADALALKLTEGTVAFRDAVKSFTGGANFAAGGPNLLGIMPDPAADFDAAFAPKGEKSFGITRQQFDQGMKQAASQKTAEQTTPPTGFDWITSVSGKKRPSAQ